MRLAVGRIGRAHGIRGEVAVDIRTDDPEARFAVGAVLLTDPAPSGPLAVKSVRTHAGGLLVRFVGITDRTGAEALGGTVLLVDSADIPAVDDPDEFHDHELIGLRAVTTSGSEVGVIEDVLHNAQDLLVIKAAGGKEVLVPFVRTLVPEVDVRAGRLLIDPPPGLIDLTE